MAFFFLQQVCKEHYGLGEGGGPRGVETSEEKISGEKALN